MNENSTRPSWDKRLERFHAELVQRTGLDLDCSRLREIVDFFAASNDLVTAQTAEELVGVACLNRDDAESATLSDVLCVDATAVREVMRSALTAEVRLIYAESLHALPWVAQWMSEHGWERYVTYVTTAPDRFTTLTAPGVSIVPCRPENLSHVRAWLYEALRNGDLMARSKQEYEQQVEEAFLQGDSPYLSLVAEVQGEPIGHAFCLLGGSARYSGTSEAELVDVSVNPEWRHLAIGRALVGEAMHQMKAKGYALVTATVVHTDRSDGAQILASLPPDLWTVDRTLWRRMG